jgi:UDP-N-acetylmuramoylalanine-D-glutamate ligase
MITSSFFKNKKILILGLGVTGSNLYKALIKSKAIVYTWDDNPLISKKISNNINPKNFKFIKIKLY